MKQINIRHFVLLPWEPAVDGLERAYREFKRFPPDAIAFSDDGGNQLFHWEDVEILHLLPTFQAKRSYYHILQTRDGVLNGKSSPEDAAETINHFLTQT